MFGGNPAIRGSSSNTGPANILATGTTVQRVIVVPVVRILESTYVLPGLASVNRRLQYGAIPASFRAPPDLHGNNWLHQRRQVKARTLYLRNFVGVICAG